MPVAAILLAVMPTAAAADALLPASDEIARPGVDVTIDTPLGKMEAQAVGPWPHAPAAVAIHGGNSDDAHIQEWDVTATALVERGFSVLLPNLHSLDGGAPSGEGFELVMNAIVPTGAMLLGKSWGGDQSARYAGTHTANLSSLVLDAPGTSKASIPSVAGQLTLPLLMLWCEDDTTVPFAWSSVWMDNAPDARLQTNETGGHWVVDEFVPYIADFAEETVPAQGQRVRRGKRRMSTADVAPLAERMHPNPVMSDMLSVLPQTDHDGMMHGAKPP